MSNKALEYVSRKAKIQPTKVIFHYNGPNLVLASADDIDIVENRILGLSSMTFGKSADSVRLKINEDQTKCMLM